MNKQLLADIDAVLLKHKVQSFEGSFSIIHHEKLEYKKQQGCVGEATTITKHRFDSTTKNK